MALQCLTHCFRLRPFQALGLVDDLVPKDQLLPAAEAVMLKLVMLPGGAVAASKKSLRGEFGDAWLKFSKVEPKGAWQFLCQPETVRTLAAALQRLSGGKAGGANGASQASKL